MRSSLPCSESVLIGRHPHLATVAMGERRGRAASHATALAARGHAATSSRGTTDTLSGGERRRVAIASLLAQAPQVFLLDEPTNHLDPHHQLAVLELVSGAGDSGRTVIATLHDPTLAARFADRVLLLSGDGSLERRPGRADADRAALSELYLTPCSRFHRRRRAFVADDPSAG